MDSMPTKRCRECSEVKPLGDFNRDARRPDGRSTTCRECRHAYLHDWEKNGPHRRADRKTLEGIAKRFWSRVDRSDADGCWVWKGAMDTRGYGRVYGVGGRVTAAHRLGYLLEYGVPIPDDLFGCHRCDNPACVRGSHVFPGTATDNIHDMVAKGRQAHLRMRDYPNRAHGDTHGRRKITSEDARRMRELYAEGHRVGKIAERFDVSYATVSYVVSGKIWKDAGGPIRVGAEKAGPTSRAIAGG